MRRFLVSLGVAIAGTGIAFFFLMSFAVSGLALYARMTGAQSQTVAIEPSALLRTVGLPLSAIVFCLCFWLAWRRSGRHPSRGLQRADT